MEALTFAFCMFAQHLFSLVHTLVRSANIHTRTLYNVVQTKTLHAVFSLTLIVLGVGDLTFCTVHIVQYLRILIVT